MDLLSNLPSRIHEILDEGKKEGEARIAFTDERGADWSYGRLAEAARDAAGELGRLGVRPGDRVMIVCENSIAAIVLLYAASRLDAWAVLANARLSGREVDMIAEDCRPRRILYVHGASAEADAHAARRGGRGLSFSAIGEVKVGPADDSAEAEPTHGEPARQVAVLIYTTGTTGRPKGVMLSHRNLAFVAARGKRTGTILPADRALCFLPISHSYGLTLMQGMLFAGGRLTIMPRFSLERAVDAIRKGEVSVFSAVPSLFGRMVAHVESSGETLVPNALRYAYTGTAPLDPGLREDVERVFGVVLHNGYGLTETSPTISRTSYRKGEGGVSIGFPIPGVEVKIRASSADRPREGELLVRGPNVMLGYYRKPEMTAEILDDEGYLHTGDIVALDDSGEIRIRGRSKELIIRSGFNVYPAEVEAALNAHADVLMSAVVGRTVEGNEEIVAFIEPREGGAIDLRDLSRHLEERLARYKAPQEVIVLDRLPIAPNGKVLKHVLARRAQAAGTPGGLEAAARGPEAPKTGPLTTPHNG